MGKPATASAVWGPDFAASHVTDGSISEEAIDYWILPSYTTGWARVDLGGPYFLNHVRWLNTHNGSSNDRAAASWRLDGSYDGVSYTELTRGTEAFSPTPAWVEIYPSPLISYRYLRLNVNGYYSRGGGVNEIEAYGVLDNPGAPNVALGKPATASGSWSTTYGPYRVTDGSCLEATVDYWLLPSSRTGWVEVDLRGIYQLGKLRWLNTHNDGANDRAATAWRLDVSEDGSSYTEFTRGVAAFSSTPSWVQFDHVSVSARYLRLSVDGYYYRGGGVNEIEAYGAMKNLARGQSASASGSWSSAYGPDKLVDGKTAETGEITYWLLPSRTSGWAQVQLDTLYQLSEIRWLNTHNGSNNDRAATSWRMAVSEDGISFQDVKGGTEIFTDNPQWVTVTGLPSAGVRYVRLFVDGYYNRGGGANEIEVLGALKLGSQNLALGKAATASGSWSPTYGPQKVTDGSTIETSADYWLLPTATTGWVQVDLGEACSPARVRWLNTHNNGANDRAATSWRLLVSVNGFDFTEVGSGTKAFSPTPTWVETPVSATFRYVRLCVDGYYNLGGGVNEIEVYQED